MKDDLLWCLDRCMDWLDCSYGVWEGKGRDWIVQYDG
jgi:hypothetical protein